MADSLAGVVLAAGLGTRLAPLTRLRPKALCPVANAPLVDVALARFDGVTSSIAVNVHHFRDLLESHLAGRVHLSIERGAPLGTAGALGRLRDWIAGRPTIVVNADSWCPVGLAALLDGWDGERIRVLVPGGGPFGPGVAVAGALLPWDEVARLDDQPSGLYERSWGRAAEGGRVEVVALDGPFVDCGTPARYLAANLMASRGDTVVGPGAVVRGVVERCVLWAGTEVLPGERLVDAIRASERMTVLVR
jgi:mannose-1-phosphate guanylyltransferase/MurNAc alpha-1-phosphate uridylyltransferase